MRYFLEIAYNGGNYHGWQVQQNATTVQEVIQQAAERLWPGSSEIVGSGRTDTGVHASQQFAHLDLPEGLLLPEHLHKLNGLLPEDIAIHGIHKVSSEAHARFDALSRSYEYRINRLKNPFSNGLSYYYNRELNIDLMNQAAALLLDHEQFQCFSKVKTEVNHFICHVEMVRWEEQNENLIFFVTANRFLRGMVRAMVGTLLEVGLKRCTLKQFKEILDSNDRRKAGRSVPPQGLFLTQVIYPDEIIIESIKWKTKRSPVR
ncbi:MAG: tRNA pseudouridine(38-40) synthase TruA [Cyclobacteriaceae bacterium]